MADKPKTLRTGNTVLFDPVVEPSRSNRAERETAAFGRRMSEFQERDRLNAPIENLTVRPSRSNRAEREPLPRYNAPPIPTQEAIMQQRMMQQRIKEIREMDRYNAPPIPTREAMMQQRMMQQRIKEIQDLQNAIRMGEDRLIGNPNNIQLRQSVEAGKKRLMELESQGMDQTLQKAMPVNPGQIIR